MKRLVTLVSTAGKSPEEVAGEVMANLETYKQAKPGRPPQVPDPDQPMRGPVTETTGSAPDG